MTPGTRLGPYEVVGPLGAGGMGEVWRARDTRLGRDVAIKVLPADYGADGDRLRRFELEARATAALNHPNILAVFDIGTHEGQPYLVEELLEGESLRARLRGGALPVARVIELAVQVAQGLAAAHEKGIVHRDLKPENLFLTRSGHLKILDFGLAKLARPDAAGRQVSEAPIHSAATEEGHVLGTVGYMAPEQVRGLPCDHRADIFALGCVLHELLSGHRPFVGETLADTLSAILSRDPPPLLGTPDREIPPALQAIVGRCLEKAPEDRFQSTRDLAFDLALVSRGSGRGVSAPPEPAVAHRRLRRMVIAAGAIAVAAACVGLALVSFSLGRRSAHLPGPRFQPLTFQRGWVSSARFTADGQTVVYSASWSGEPTEVFSIRLGSPESVPLGYTHADLLAVSPTGELALLRSPEAVSFPALVSILTRWPSVSAAFFPKGSTLALAPFSGGTPRGLEASGFAADYSPDGRALAVARVTATGTQLEYPQGTVRSEGAWGTRAGRHMASLTVARLSPDGRQLAYLKGGTELVVAEISGGSTTLASDLVPNGFAWSPDGSEVWIVHGEELRAVSLSGRQRTLCQLPYELGLQDVARDGRVLVTLGQRSRRLFFRGEHDERERELSWLDWSMPSGLSADGRLLVIWEAGYGVVGVPMVCVRDTGGAPPVKLGDGRIPTLSPDERFVAAVRRDGSEIAVYPIGPGAVQTVQIAGIHVVMAFALDGGRTLCFTGHEPSRPSRIWVTDTAGSRPRPISPEGVRLRGLTPDGTGALGMSGPGWLLYPLAEGEPREVKGLQERDWIAALAADGQTAFAYRRTEAPVRIFKVNLRTGERELHRELTLPDPVSPVMGPTDVCMTRDGASYAYSYVTGLRTLYLVEGLK